MVALLPTFVQLPAFWLMMGMDELSSLKLVLLAAHPQPAEGVHTPSSPN